MRRFPTLPGQVLDIAGMTFDPFPQAPFGKKRCLIDSQNNRNAEQIEMFIPELCTNKTKGVIAAAGLESPQWAQQALPDADSGRNPE